jgi:hypothetical protein
MLKTCRSIASTIAAGCQPVSASLATQQLTKINAPAAEVDA